MEIVIIGSGHVATVLGKAFQQKGHHIRQVWSRNETNAAALAAELSAAVASNWSDIYLHADLYLLAVTDSALTDVAGKLSLGDRLVVHVAGAVSKEVLRETSSRSGVLWPMKMIRKSMTSLQPVTIVVDGNTGEVTETIRQLALQLSPDVIQAGDHTRLQMHVVAAFISNFTNHLYHLAADFCAQENIDFGIFYPLILETVQQTHNHAPGEIQAGPAFRGDERTLQLHRKTLEQYPRLEKIYAMMTDSIRQTFGR